MKNQKTSSNYQTSFNVFYELQTYLLRGVPISHFYPEIIFKINSEYIISL